MEMDSNVEFLSVIITRNNTILPDDNYIIEQNMS